MHRDAPYASAADRREKALAHGCNVEDEEAAAAHAEHLIKCYIKSLCEGGGGANRVLVDHLQVAALHDVERDGVLQRHEVAVPFSKLWFCQQRCQINDIV